MTLATGTRLGPYEILSALGAGGMGEVYQARDTRLDRLVAVKVLSQALAGSADARERLEREARAISRLSHPNICALFDVGRAGEVSYLVMELLEGQTLAALVARGSVPMADVLRMGGEIAKALGAAHRLGIVHRDLKPGNVMLTNAGAKLLDFGLAKVLHPAGGPSDPNAMPTAAELTAPGTWLGTAPYMSPEQIDGRPVDARSDIFALGAVLHEMATGQRAFGGQTSTAIAAAVLLSDPPAVSSVMPAASPAFDRLVRTCLEKDPDRRWQSAHDVALQLSALAAEAPHLSSAQASSSGRTTSLGWAVAAAAIAVAAGTFVVGRWNAPLPERLELQIAPPSNTTFASDVEAVRFSLSPDGRQLAFVATGPGPVRRVWMRGLSSIESTPIAGTEGARSVFWSPDARAIAFFVGDTLKRLDLDSGAAVAICKVPSGGGVTGTWSREGQILFAAVGGDAIFRVSTAGGSAIVEVKPDPARDEVGVSFPFFLPDGRQYLYLAKHRDNSGALLIGEAGKAPRTVTGIESNAQYVEPGTLVFARGGALVGQPFDVESGRVSGEPIAIAESVRFFISTGLADFSTSPSGALVYQSHGNRQRLAWVDRAGRELGPVGSSGEYLSVRVTPPGRSALMSRTLPSTGAYDVWSLDFERGTETRLTLDDDVTEIEGVFSPDGASMFYSVARGGPPRLMRRDLRTGRDDAVLPAGGRFQQVNDLSRDGRVLAYEERADGGHSNLWTLPLQGAATPSRLRQSAFNEGGLRFAPDGQHYSFVSNESGRSEVYVARLGGGPKTLVSSGIASGARWSGDGRELFYVSADSRLVAVPVRTEPGLQVGSPVTLFAIGSRRWGDFDVSPDGKRFLALIPEVVSNEQPLTALQHWNKAAPR